MSLTSFIKIPEVKAMFRNEFPCCLIQQVNNVLTTIPIPSGFVDKYAPELLDSMYMDGKRLDWKHAGGVVIGNVWSNRFFRVG